MKRLRPALLLPSLPLSGRAQVGRAVLWLAAAVLALTLASPALADSPLYAVKPGDTLASIAAKHGTTVTALMRVNNIQDANLIRAGQKLKLPDGASLASPGENAASPATAVVSSTPTRVYVVQPGDSLASVATRFKTTAARLAELNRRSPSAALDVGEPLRVPDAQTADIVFATLQGDDIPTPGSYTVHVLQPGESMAAVAAAYGTSLRRTLQVNKNLDPANLKPGTRIIVPPPSFAELFADVPIGPDDYPVYPMTPTTGKWISVDLDHQRAFAWEGNQLIKSFWISSGKARTPTVTGVFRIWAKIAAQRMEGGSRAAGDYYNLPNVQWVQYFYQDYSFHGTYWHHNFGTPMSHGCVNMSNADAKWLYDWASPTITDNKWHVTDAKDPGTLVIVYQ